MFQRGCVVGARAESVNDCDGQVSPAIVNHDRLRALREDISLAVHRTGLRTLLELSSAERNAILLKQTCFTST